MPVETALSTAVYWPKSVKPNGVTIAFIWLIAVVRAIIAAIALTLRRRKDTKAQDPARQVAARREDRVRIVSMPPEKKQ